MGITTTLELSDFDDDDVIEYLIDDILPFASQSDKDKISNALIESYPEHIIEPKTIEEKDKLDLLKTVFDKHSLIELQKIFPNF